MALVMMREASKVIADFAGFQTMVSLRMNWMLGGGRRLIIVSVTRRWMLEQLRLYLARGYRSEKLVYLFQGDIKRRRDVLPSETIQKSREFHTIVKGGEPTLHIVMS